MSDKKNISLQDRGWNDMKSLLDKEMPVRKKKRGGFVWLIFLGLLIGLGSVFFVTSYQTDINGTETKVEIASDEKAQFALNMAEADHNTNKIQIDVAKESTNTDAGLLSGEPVQEQESSNAIQKNNFDTQTEISESSKLKSSTENSLDQRSNQSSTLPDDIVEDVAQSIFSADEVVENQNVALNTKSRSLENTIVNDAKEKNDLSLKQINESTEFKLDYEGNNLKEEKNALSGLSFLPVLNYAPLVNVNKPSLALTNVQSPIIRKAAVPHLLSPYAYVSGNYQLSESGHGYELGAGIDLSKGRWGVYFELGYARTQFDNAKFLGSSLPEGTSSDVEDGMNIENGAFVNVGSNEEISVELNSFSNLVSSTEEIKFDLGVNFGLTKKLSLDGGIGYSRLVSADNQSFTVQSMPVEGGLTPELVTVSVTNKEFYEQGAYSSYDLIPHFGIEYNLFANAFLSINYQHGLKNLLNNSINSTSGTLKDRSFLLNNSNQEESFYRRNVEVKLRYLF